MDRTVLVVDDSRLARMVVIGILGRTRPTWSVLEAAGARQALDILDERPVDIVLVDFNMPETDGLALAARIREKSRDLPVAIISANAQHAIMEQARALDVAFLEKPLTDETLASFVSGAVLRLRRAEP
ncbi:MAG TPA: response regulator [Arenibaculum sp.]|nr:response regulator [Arenibaculum sp.]